MAEDITGQAAVTVSREGGTILEFVDTSVLNGWMLAYIGPNGDNTDTPAYPVERGRGMALQVIDGAFSVTTPPLAVGGPYYLTLVRVGGMGDAPSLTSNTFITVVPQQVPNRVLKLRGRLYADLKVGYRSVDALEYPQA